MYCLKKRWVLVGIGAGLGNQLFQYAFARYVQSQTSRRVLLFSWAHLPISLRYFDGIMKLIFRGDRAALRGLKSPGVFRYLALDNFAISLKTMSPLRSWLLFRSGARLSRFLPFSIQFIDAHDPSVHMESLSSDKSVLVFLGSWWNGIIVNQIRDLLVDDLQFVSVPSTRSQELATQISATPNAVALHLRRNWGAGGSDVTDKGQRLYTGLHTMRSLPADYYAQAIPLVERKLHRPTFFVFADNIKKARGLLASLPQRSAFVYIDPAGRMPWEDLYLMQQCQHFVLSNSTFAWWGAWLGTVRRIQQTSLIIMPSIWYVGSDESHSRCMQIGDNTIRNTSSKKLFVPNILFFTWQHITVYIFIIKHHAQ